MSHECDHYERAAFVALGARLNTEQRLAECKLVINVSTSIKDEPLRYEGIAAEASELGLPDRPAAGKTNFVRPEEQERTAKRMGFVFHVIRTARNS